MNREPILGLPSVDIGTVRRIVVLNGGSPDHFEVHTDFGVFEHYSDKSWRAYQFGFEHVQWGDPRRPFQAWAMSESMALVASIARLEYELVDKLKPGEDVPLFSDEEGWDYMLKNRFPAEPKDTWRHFEAADWININGNRVNPPDWFRSYWQKLLYHRQNEWMS